MVVLVVSTVDDVIVEVILSTDDVVDVDVIPVVYVCDVTTDDVDV